MAQTQLEEEGELEGWSAIWVHILNSLKSAVFEVNLVVCFVVIVVCCSGLGVIASWFISSIPDYIWAINTYYPAIVASSAIDYFFNNEYRRYFMGYAIGVSFIEFVLFVSSLALAKWSHNGWSLTLAIVAVVFAWVVWICDNANNPLFANTFNPNNSSGGDVFSKKLPSDPLVKTEDKIKEGETHE